VLDLFLFGVIVAILVGLSIDSWKDAYNFLFKDRD